MSLVVTATPESIARAAAVLRDGGIVGLPTETVYGLAADATNGVAVAKVFAAKGRPAINPLIVHIADMETAERLASFTDAARDLATALWPGPLSIILKRRADSGISDLAMAGLSTIALRMPAHDVARAVIAASGKPIAAPSANASGTLSPTSASHVAESLGDKVDLILAAGSAGVGLESTVIDMTGDVPVILRPGAVTPEDIERVLGIKPAIDSGHHDQPKSPGQLLRHYAPGTKLRLNATDKKEDEAYLAFGPTMLTRGKVDPAVKNLSPNGDLNEAAANLFGYLHALDKGGYAAIAVSPIPDQGLGLAINDRLRRAVGAQN